MINLEQIDEVSGEELRATDRKTLMFNNGDFVAPLSLNNLGFQECATREIPIFRGLSSSPVDGEEFVLERKYKKTCSNRDSLESLVLKRGYEFSRSKNYFTLQSSIKNEIVSRGLLKAFENENYNNKNEYLQKQKKYFFSCGGICGNGEFRVGTDESGQDVSQSVVFRCGSKYCMSCRERERKRVLKKYINYFSQFLRLSHCYRIQFTLPSEISSLILSNVAYDKIYDDEIIEIIVKTVRETFGFKTRSNMPILVSRHIVGNTGGFFKNHLHYHVICFPFEILTSKTETGEKNFSIKYSLITGKKAALSSSILCYCHDLYESNLSEKFEFNNVNTPHFSFISQISENSKEKESKDKDAKLAHAVRYDARSFVSDFQKSFPCSESTGAYFYESDKKCGMKYIFHNISSIVDRTNFVLINSKYYNYGILTNMKRLDSVFKYFEEQSIIFDLKYSEKAGITRRFNTRSGATGNKIKIDEYISLYSTNSKILIDTDMTSNLSFSKTLKKFGPVAIFNFYKRLLLVAGINLECIVKVVDNIMYFSDTLNNKKYTFCITNNERALFRKFLHRSIPFTRTVKVSKLTSIQLNLNM